MGNSASKAANDVGSVIANALAAPFKSIFGRSCQDVCEGIWDVVCFIEHICIADLVKLLLVCGLCYVCIVFLYLLYKLGVCQCVVKSMCKMCWAACETYWLTLDYICCFCWHKIRYTKRVYRGRHHHLRRQLSRDVELGYASSYASSDADPRDLRHGHVGKSMYDDDECGSSFVRKRKSRRGRRRRRVANDRTKMRMKGRQVSVHLGGRSRRGRRRSSFKNVRMSSLGRSRRNNTKKFKRRRLDDS